MHHVIYLEVTYKRKPLHFPFGKWRNQELVSEQYVLIEKKLLSMQEVQEIRLNWI